jgi:hypothetical protein
MVRTRQLALAFAAFIALLAFNACANAQSNDSKQHKKIVQSMCRAVMTAARPSTFDQDLDIVSHDTKFVNERLVEITFVVDWKGSLTGKSYRSRFTFTAYLSDKKIELIGLNYRDNANHWQWNQRNLDRLLPVMNDLLDIALRQ